MKRKIALEHIKAPVLFAASEEESWSDPVLSAEGGIRSLFFTRHSTKEGTDCRMVSRSRDLLRWSEPVPADIREEEGIKKGPSIQPDAQWSRFFWAADGVKGVSAAWDEELRMYLAVYEGGCRDGKDGAWRGSLGIAASRDLVHWQSFLRDEATYPDNGIIYEGDYYQAIPFGEYIHPEAVPQGEPVFDVRDYGAIPDGETLSTQAVQGAIDAAAQAGGGIVLVAGGHYCVGTIRLADNITLWISHGSALCASRDLKNYGDALVACVGARNVKIAGGGKIIGRGEYFVYLPKKPPLLKPLEETKLPPVLYDPMGYPVDTIRYAYRCRIRYAEDKYAEGLKAIGRPMYTVWVRDSREVVIENIMIQDALDWTLVVDLSRGVKVRDVVINGNRHVANTDGIDIMGSSQVEIRHCFVSCADDGICIKSPRKQGHDGITIGEADAKMAGTEDIHVSGCTVVSVMNGFKIGTETYFDIKNVRVEDCRLMLPDIYPGMVSGISIESADGSHISDIHLKGIWMEKVCCPVFICLNMRNKYGFADEADKKARYFGGSIENVTIEEIEAWDVEVPSIITGFQVTEDGKTTERRVRDIRIRDFKAVYRDNKEVLSLKDKVYENVRDYPENNAFGDVPAYGFYIRHADRVSIEDWQVIPRTMNTREAVVREYTDKDSQA